ncbi:hypothetical protein [Actinokineospora alba]|uniref:hypothetical protein n=1 Tax=Actinokineospora alba TaxID=504798 RepID=UPI000B86B2E1|nr:hypothetical protein [Actinokineospora alba]
MSDTATDGDPVDCQEIPPGLGARLVPAAAMAVMVALALVLVWRVGALEDGTGRVPAAEMVVPIPAP